jgi:hypothetical protein
MPRPQSSAGPGSYELGGLAQDILHKQVRVSARWSYGVVKCWEWLERDSTPPL